MTPPIHLVVMGVSGCGKSSVGRAIAHALQLPMIEGDDFHSPASQDKMRRGVALTDADRASWLDTLGEQLAARPQGAVLACSALKKAYRDRLRAKVPGLRFLFLALDEATARERVAERGAAHLFPPSLVASQFQTLEPPDDEAGVLRVDATRPVEALCGEALDWLQAKT